MALTTVFIFSSPSFAWQGRMSGMAEPYGLIPDESDFLIHPSLITRGEGFDVYSHVDFTYTDIYKWDMDLDVTSSPWEESFDSSGNQYDYGALLGIAFPLGAGRIGIFFEYDGMDRDIDGDADYLYSTSSFNLGDTSTSADYDLDTDMDSFSLRLIYGLPVDFNCLNIGGEAKISYIDEKQNSNWENNAGTSLENQPLTSYLFWWEANTLWFQIPYDSDYWDAQFKASADGKICFDGINPLDITLTVGAGFIFSGDNEYNYSADMTGVRRAYVDVDGSVDGYNLGGELWLRYPVNDDFSIPYLVRAEVRHKDRDGNGTAHDPDGWLGFDDFDISYEQKEEVIEIETGGGLDIKLSETSRIAAGLFYTYIKSANDFTVILDDPGSAYIGTYDDNTPDYREHQISFKLGWENSLSDTATIRAGFKTFWGFIDKDFEFDYSDTLGFYENDNTNLDGHQWGIMASFGSSIKLSSVTLEPYINAGYRDLDLDGDLDFSAILPALVGSVNFDVDEDRQEWFVGCGLSILFGN